MRINLWGGAGCGKSTSAARIFGELRQKGYDIELCQEYIKQWAYQKRIPKSFDQLYIFGKQVYTEDLMWQAGVKHLITDSPLLMQGFYATIYNTPVKDELVSLAKKYELIHPSINIFLDRKDIPYQQNGRYETIDEAIERDHKMIEFLKLHKISYHIFMTKDYHSIMSYIEKNLTF